MPIPLGVLAVAGAGVPVAAGNAYELLETEILTGTVSTITFDNLNSTYGSTYQHLQLRYTARSNRATVDTGLRIRLNNDSGNNYDFRRLYGTGASVLGAASTSQSSILLGTVHANNATANFFTAGVLDILDPFETTKYTTTRNLNAAEGTDEDIGLYRGLWKNSTALTDITFLNDLGSFVAGTRISLYGLRSS